VERVPSLSVDVVAAVARLGKASEDGSDGVAQRELEPWVQQNPVPELAKPDLS
jgi:hypothetical protein